jgi:hypothetical protein
LKWPTLADVRPGRIIKTSDSTHYRQPEHRLATTANNKYAVLLSQKEHALLEFLIHNVAYAASFLSWKIAANGRAGKVFVYEEKGVSASTMAFS